MKKYGILLLCVLLLCTACGGGTMAPPSSSESVLSSADSSSASIDAPISPEPSSSAQQPSQSQPSSSSSRPGPSMSSAVDLPQTVCALEVECKTALAEGSGLSDGVRNILPSNGVLFTSNATSFTQGESAFDILLRTLRESGIPMEFSTTPGMGTKYVEGIGNLYEFDAGPLSGWVYSVNGRWMSVSCSSYIVQPGDHIAFRYTCAMGKDLEGGGDL